MGWAPVLSWGLVTFQDTRESSFFKSLLVAYLTRVRQPPVTSEHLGVDQIVGGPDGKLGALLLDQLEAVIRLLFRQQIAERAYALYEQRGRREGFDLEDWFEAGQQILKPHLHTSSMSS